jgi:hypothetical protein
VFAVEAFRADSNHTVSDPLLLAELAEEPLPKSNLSE